MKFIDCTETVGKPCGIQMSGIKLKIDQNQRSIVKLIT
jgi:hypothetical protein